MLNYLIDILFLIIAVVTVAIFTKRGFVQSFFKYSRTFLAVIAAYIFGPNVGRFIYDRFIYNSIHDWVSSKLDSYVHAVIDGVNIDSVMEDVPFIVRQFVNEDGIKDKFNNAVESIEMSVSDFSALVSEPFANLLSNLISYVLVFLLALLVLLIIGSLLDLITKLPILHGINAFLGLLFGIAATFLLLSALTYVLSIIIGTFGNILYLKELSESSYLFGFFDRLHLFDLL